MNTSPLLKTRRINPDMPDNRFTQCFKWLLDLEGISYENVAGDSGGGTKYGVTHAVNDEWRQRKGLAPKDITELTLDEAGEIYEEQFWNPMRCPVLLIPFDFAMFQWGVNHGVGGAIETLQKAIFVDADGNFGMKTMAAVLQYDPHLLTRIFLDQQKKEYDAIIAAEPEKEKFRKGWYSRIIRTANFCGISYTLST